MVMTGQFSLSVEQLDVKGQGQSRMYTDTSLDGLGHTVSDKPDIIRCWGLAASDTLLQVTQPGLSEQQSYVTPAWVEPLQGADPPGLSTSCRLMELTLNRAGPLLPSAGLGQWPNSVPAPFTKARQGKAVFTPPCSWQQRRGHRQCFQL